MFLSTSQGGMLESKLKKHTEVGGMVSGTDQRNPAKDVFPERGAHKEAASLHSTIVVPSLSCV